jgi:hypothetical protein
LSGGNTGRLFAELDDSGSGVNGMIGLHDGVHGVVVLACVGQFDGAALELRCTPPPTPPPDGEPGEISLRGGLHPDGQIQGTWTSSSGGDGAFVLFPDPQ